MRKFLFLILVSFTFCVCAQNVADVFVSMPDNIKMLHSLPPDVRKKLMMDYLLFGKDSVETQKGVVKIDTLDSQNTYLKVRTSNIGSFFLKLYPSGTSYKVLYGATACAPACNTFVYLLNADFSYAKKVSVFQGDVVGIFSFLKDKNIDSDRIREISSKVAYCPIRFDVIPQSNQVIVKLDLKNYLLDEEYEQMKGLFLDELRMTWDESADDFKIDNVVE